MVCFSDNITSKKEKYVNTFPVHLAAVMSLQDKCDIYRGKSDCLLRMDIAALSL
jgi:hypothetical protein